MERSYDLLSPREQAILRRFSVFSGGWNLAAAEAVCSDLQGIPDAEILDLLKRLIDKSMVQFDEENRSRRYWLLKTMKQFAGERLREVGEAIGVRSRHARFFLSIALAAETELDGRNQVEWLYRLEREHGNLMAALNFFVDQHDSSAALLLSDALLGSFSRISISYCGHIRNMLQEQV